MSAEIFDLLLIGDFLLFFGLAGSCTVKNEKKKKKKKECCDGHESLLSVDIYRFAVVKMGDDSA